MAQIENPKKIFNFTIQTPGLNPFLAQKVTTSELNINVDEHGDINYIVKTAGNMNVGTLMVEKISQSLGADPWIWDWIKLCQDVYLGGGTPASVYKRTIEVIQYSTDGINIINRWVHNGCWPSKINGVELNRAESGNVLESIEFQVDQMQYL